MHARGLVELVLSAVLDARRIKVLNVRPTRTLGREAHGTMDIKLNEVTLPAFLWYVLPGLNFICLVVLLPVLFVRPSWAAPIQSLGGVAAIILAALVCGFIMDSLKLYRLTPGYSRIRTQFFKEIAEALRVDQAKAVDYFDAIRVGISKWGSLGEAVAFDHSRWVMINLTSKCFYLLGALWLLIGLSTYSRAAVPAFHQFIGRTAPESAFYVEIPLAGMSFLVGLRLSRIAKDHLHRSNSKYLLYLSQNEERTRTILGGADGVASKA